MVNQRRGWVVTVGLLVSGLSMLVFGFWAWIWPDSFAAFTGFEVHTHYLHDAGVFQIGIGVALLLSLLVDDAVTVALAAFVVASTLHTLNHGIDLHLGGDLASVYGLGAFSLVGAIALVARLVTLRRSEDHPPHVMRRRRQSTRGRRQ
jgi:MFS family permease